MSSSPAKHLIRHAVDIIKREKKKRRAPVINAPIILVAAKVIPKRIIAPRIVPKIPASNNERGVRRQRQVFLQPNLLLAKSTTPRYTTAIPSSTHKNAGVTVIVAVIVSNVVIIPIITLAPMASNEQLIPQQLLQLHFVFDIFFTSRIIIRINKTAGDILIKKQATMLLVFCL